MFEVLETTKKIVQKSRFAGLDRQALDAAVRRMIEQNTGIPPWDSQHHFFDGGVKTVAYFFVLDTLNFCFWALKGKGRWEIEFEGRRISGYYALATALKKAVENGVPLHKADFLAGLSVDDLKEMLGGQGELLLMNRRAANLNELGRVLLDEFNGEACNLVEAAERSALGLAGLLSEKLSSYRDVAVYEGEKVFFLKRAQILAADLYGAFRGRDWGEFTDVDRLTAFADYKLPQVLRQLGILRYAPALAEKVDQRVLLAPGSPEEVEIRANTIRAVELMRRELQGRGRNLKAFEIDWLLWNMGQKDRFREKPYHRTLTIYY